MSYKVYLIFGLIYMRINSRLHRSSLYKKIQRILEYESYKIRDARVSQLRIAARISTFFAFSALPAKKKRRQLSSQRFFKAANKTNQPSFEISLHFVRKPPSPPFNAHSTIKEKLSSGTLHTTAAAHGNSLTSRNNKSIVFSKCALAASSLQSPHYFSSSASARFAPITYSLSLSSSRLSAFFGTAYTYIHSTQKQTNARKRIDARKCSTVYVVLSRVRHFAVSSRVK